jgi:hypothetical protein
VVGSVIGSSPGDLRRLVLLILLTGAVACGDGPRPPVPARAWALVAASRPGLDVAALLPAIARELRGSVDDLRVDERSVRIRRNPSFVSERGLLLARPGVAVTSGAGVHAFTLVGGSAHRFGAEG